MRFKCFALLLFAVALGLHDSALVHAQMRRGRILAVASYGAQPFQEVLAGFKEQLLKMGVQNQVDSVPLDGDAGKVSKALEQVSRQGADLVLALGTTAAAGIVGRTGDLPVVVSLVLDAEGFAGKGNVTGVILDIPSDMMLQSITRVLPGKKNIGVVYNPLQNRGKIESVTSMAEKMGLNITLERVEKIKDLPQALESLSRKVDILWGIHDETVYTPQTAKQILLFCYQNRIPFVGLSDAWVKAGALFSVDADYREVGCQCAEMAASILKGQNAGSIPVARPRKVTRSINLKTAQHMKLEIPSSVIGEATEVYQ